jgi:hypothetical protein
VVNVSRKHVNGSTKSIRSSRSRVKAKAKTKAMGPIHVALRYCNPLMNIMTEMWDTFALEWLCREWLSPFRLMIIVHTRGQDQIRVNAVILVARCLDAHITQLSQGQVNRSIWPFVTAIHSSTSWQRCETQVHFEWGCRARMYVCRWSDELFWGPCPYHAHLLCRCYKIIWYYYRMKQMGSHVLFSHAWPGTGMVLSMMAHLQGFLCLGLLGNAWVRPTWMFCHIWIGIDVSSPAQVVITCDRIP